METLLEKLEAMDKDNFVIEVNQFKVFYYPDADINCYDILGTNGIEGDYMTKQEVINYIEKNK